ncbi:conserved exported hypothetical protein [Candidatus Sulfopaludibacter sp. SbA4]|nr:conserved exported hypothetical protein [Candidatus Sulfopaludibacter sp. SbA4]
MTNFTTRMMIAAATLVVAAGAASAQTMKAEIPFTFRAGDTVMAPGTYEIHRIHKQSGTPLFRVSDSRGEHAIALMPIGSGDPKKAWEAGGAPLLSFDCVASRCALSGIWTGPLTPAYVIRHGKLGNDEPVRVALIEMRPNKSE